jgi:hypothetical protein
LLDERFGRLALGVVVVEDGRPVLRAHVRALAVQGRRVVDREEHRQEILERHAVGIVLHLNNLGMAGVPPTDRFVGRVLDVATGVAGGRGLDTHQFVERGLDTPETAAAERGGLEGLVG